MMLIGFDGVKLNCGYYCDVDVFHVWLVGQETTTERRQATRDPVGGLPGVKRKGPTSPKRPKTKPEIRNGGECTRATQKTLTLEKPTAFFTGMGFISFYQSRKKCDL
jgi:hypothetical protein